MTPEPIGFIFDIDGVVCNNNAWHRSSWLDYARQLGKELTEDDIVNRVYGKTNAEILHFVLDREPSPDELHHHAEAKEALYREQYRPHFCLTEGLASFMKEAHSRGIRMALASNAPESNVTFTVEMGKLGELLTAVVHAAQVKNAKPAPDVYLEAARRIGLDPHRCVVFEDSLPGIAAGIAAGSPVVGIASTMPFEQLEKLVSRVVPDFTHLTVDDAVNLLHKGPHMHDLK